MGDNGIAFLPRDARIKKVGSEYYLANWRAFSAEQLAALESAGLIASDNTAHRAHGLAARLTWAGKAAHKRQGGALCP